MKKIFIAMMSIILVLSLSSCGNKDSNSLATNENEVITTDEQSEVNESTSETDSVEQPSDSSEKSSPETDSKSLVVYFSLPETTDADNMTQEEDNSVVVIDGEVLGNTQYVANVIQENTGADIFRIEPKTPYTTDHDALVDLAAEEQANDARP